MIDTKYFLFLLLIFKIPDLVWSTRADCLMPNLGRARDKVFEKRETSCKRSIEGNEKCNFACRPGYTELPSTRLFCMLDATNKASWTETPRCVQQTCITMKQLVKIPIYAKFKLIKDDLDINLVVLYISYDTSKKMPQYSIALFDKLNQIKLFNRTELGETGIQHPCAELKNKITTSQDYENSQYDKGHLTPFNVMRFSWKSARSSNLLVNVAPQAPYVNKNVWQNIESNLEEFLTDYNAIVITGVCSSYEKYQFFANRQQKSLNVPRCFWKLVCYKEQSRAIVFGFWHFNSITVTEDEKSAIKNEAKKVRTQEFIRANIDGLDLNVAWEESRFLLESKRKGFAQSSFYAKGLDYPDYSECAKANTFPESKATWFASKFSKKRKFSQLERSFRLFNTENKRSKRIVGYFPWSNFTSRQLMLLSHISFVSFQISKNEALAKDENRLNEFRNLAFKYPHLKKMYSFGFESLNFTFASLEPIMNIIEEFEFDGVELVLLNPEPNFQKNSIIIEFLKQLKSRLQEKRRKLNKSDDYQLSLSIKFNFSEPDVDLSFLLMYIDWINLVPVEPISKRSSLNYTNLFEKNTDHSHKISLGLTVNSSLEKLNHVKNFNLGGISLWTLMNKRDEIDSIFDIIENMNF